jgi:HhH-GPD superfamily base excision DNA repair protein
VRAIFDLDAGWGTIARTLGTDSVLASYIRCDPGLRVPGCKNASNLRRERSEQQIDIRRANTLADRILRNFGQPFGAVGGITHLFPTPEVLANADLESIGLPRVKADAIRALARGVRDGQISLKKLQTRVPLLTRLYEIPELGAAQRNGYGRQDRKGVVFLLNVTSVEEAHSLLEKLRLGQTGLMEFDLMPLGPLNPLRLLLSK